MRFDDVLLKHAELNGDVEDGAGLVLRADVLVFADGEDELEARAAALRAAVPQAEWSSGITAQGVRPDAGVIAAALALAAAGLLEPARWRLPTRSAASTARTPTGCTGGL